MTSILSLELIFALVMFGAGSITGFWFKGWLDSKFKGSSKSN